MSNDKTINNTAQNVVDLIKGQLAGTDFDEDYLLSCVEEAIENSEKKPKCYYCDKPATRMCDAFESFPVENNGFYATDRLDLVEQCDRPLCHDHAEKVGMSTASGQVDTVDYCPKHMMKKKMGEKPELKPVGNRCCLTFWRLSGNGDATHLLQCSSKFNRRQPIKQKPAMSIFRLKRWLGVYYLLLRNYT